MAWGLKFEGLHWRASWVDTDVDRLQTLETSGLSQHVTDGWVVAGPVHTHLQAQCEFQGILGNSGVTGG